MRNKTIKRGLMFTSCVHPPPSPVQYDFSLANHRVSEYYRATPFEYFIVFPDFVKARGNSVLKFL